MAQIGGVSRRAQVNYEKGISFPDAAYLARVARAGFDVQYVITGKRSSAERHDLDANLLQTSMKLVDDAALEKGITLSIGLLSSATAVVYKRLNAAEDIQLEAAKREAANVVDVLASADSARHEMRTGSKAIDERLAENLRLRVLDVKRFLEETRDSLYGKFIEQDLGDPRSWPGRERVKLLLALHAERLIRFGQGAKIWIVNEGRCAAWLSREIDQLRKRLAGADRAAGRPSRKRAA